MNPHRKRPARTPILPGAVGEALTRILTKARSQTIPVEFAVDLTECPEELRGLPWEGLRHPEVDGPLALHPLVDL